MTPFQKISFPNRRVFNRPYIANEKLSINFFERNEVRLPSQLEKINFKKAIINVFC